MATADDDSGAPPPPPIDPAVFAVSWAARPVFARYDLGDRQATFAALLSALVSSAHAMEDRLVGVDAFDDRGRHARTLAFVEHGPLYFLAVSSPELSAATLRAMLDRVHDQIIVLLSRSAHALLQNRPGYDLHRLIVGADSLLEKQVRRSVNQFAFQAGAVPSVVLRAATRHKVADTIIRHRIRQSRVLFVAILRGTALVQLAHPNGKCLPLDDLLLLITFVNHLEVLHMSDTFTPICLPTFNAKAFVYAHISLLCKGVFLVQITPDSNDITFLQRYKDNVVADLSASGLMNEINRAVLHPPLFAIGVPHAQVRHCIAINRSAGQMITTRVRSPLEDIREHRMQCTRLHQHTLSQIAQFKVVPKVYVEVHELHTLLGMRVDSIDVFAILSPLTPTTQAIQIGRIIGSAIHSRDADLFALRFAVW